jgi:hypothetical protein
MAKVRTSAGVTKGSSGAKSVNPLYAAARGVARYVGGAAREIRDIPTAIGTGSASETARQIKEAAAAITSGQKGSAVTHKSALGDVKYGGRRDGHSA